MAASGLSCPLRPGPRGRSPERLFMFASIAHSIFGSANDRALKAYRRRVPQINALEPAMEALSDEALRARTAEFRERLAGGVTLDEILPEAFATVREASKRTLGQRHFDM